MGSDRSWRPRGRPALGAAFGLLFGVLLVVDLLLAGAFPLHDGAVALIPLVTLAVGLVLGWWAPLGRRTPATPPDDELTIFAQRQVSELRTLADDDPSR